jgi:tungstate transport system permease protein
MAIGPARRVATLLWDARFSLVTIALAGFGRAAAEVGAVMIVGGNIDGFTRVMTTTIALETSRGDLPLALGLGIVLISVILTVNAMAWAVRGWSDRPPWRCLCRWRDMHPSRRDAVDRGRAADRADRA